MVDCVAAGGKQVLLKRGNVRAQPGRKTFAYLVLSDLQGKGPVRQRSILADLIFWLLFDQVAVAQHLRFNLQLYLLMNRDFQLIGRPDNDCI